MSAVAPVQNCDLAILFMPSKCPVPPCALAGWRPRQILILWHQFPSLINVPCHWRSGHLTHTSSFHRLQFTKVPLDQQLPAANAVDTVRCWLSSFINAVHRYSQMLYLATCSLLGNCLLQTQWLPVQGSRVDELGWVMPSSTINEN